MTITDLLKDGMANAVNRKRWLHEGNPDLAHDVLSRNRVASGKGAHGAVASGSPHATRAGMEILRRGGNATDAAASAAFAMMVSDPPNASPAGRGHILWARKGDIPKAIDGATKIPSLLPEGVRGFSDRQALPLPGIVRAVVKFQAEAGRLPLQDVVEAARRLARDGFEVPLELAQIWAWRAPELTDEDARRHYLPDGKPVGEGEVFRNPGLADFFDQLAETGRDPFSDPDFASGICERLLKKGAHWSVDDLIAADPLDGEIVRLDGENWNLTSIGRQGWGHTLLRIVALVHSAGASNPLDTEIAHLLSILRAFEERPEELRSLKPKVDPLPWDALFHKLNDPLPADWAETEVLAKAVERVRMPDSLEDRDTTHLSVVDADGMRVALTQSIGPHFGARVADPETGILLAHSYRMAQDPLPGARDVTEQCPCFLDMPAGQFSLGGAGSERIPGAVAAVIRHLLDGKSLSRALAAPRSNWVGATARLHLDVASGLEDRLTGAGVEFEYTGRGPVDHLGIVQAVGQSVDGQVMAAADPAYAGTASAE
jgi:gamma-glutamyltranspeptidase/glutathione hydrolase